MRFAVGDAHPALAYGRRIPLIGTRRIKGHKNDTAVCWGAIRTVSRHSDSVYLYDSACSVGKAIRESVIDRNDFFITPQKDNFSTGGVRRERIVETRNVHPTLQ